MPIKLQDDYYAEADIEALKKVTAKYWEDLNISFIEAYNNIENANWFYRILRHSTLFKVFNTFPVDETAVIKAFIAYNNNPSFYNFENIISLIFSSKTKITYGNKTVTIILSAESFKYHLKVIANNIDNNLAVKTEANTSSLAIVYPIPYILEKESFYILRHFIPLGVSLKVKIENINLR